MLDKGIGPPGYHQKYYLDRDWRAYTDILARIVRYSSPGPILDLGAGCGYLVEAVHLWGGLATGLEGSVEAVELAKSRAPKLDMRHHRLSDPLPCESDSYQTVVLNQVIEHLEPPIARRVVEESLRVLRPGGLLLIASPSSANRYEAQIDPTHINLMTPTELKDLLIHSGFDRATSWDVALPIFGKSWLLHGAATALFKVFPVDRLSASANAMAFKPGDPQLPNYGPMEQHPSIVETAD
jgi:SAM-dependent methyltransferase